MSAPVHTQLHDRLAGEQDTVGLVVVDDEVRDHGDIDASGEQERRAVVAGGGVGLLLVGRDDTGRALRTDRALRGPSGPGRRCRP